MNAPSWPECADPRVAHLPATPDAVEAHVRADGTCDLVVGYNGTRFPELAAAIPLLAPAHAQLWAAWLAAAGPAPLDAGLQLGPARVQLYLRGHYAPEVVARAATAAGIAPHAPLIANAFALFGTSHAEMIGLELGEHTGMAVYLAVRHVAETRAPLADAIGFLVAATCGPDQAKRWRAVAEPMLRTVTEEYVYVSFPPDLAQPWVKIDVGARPVALAAVVAERLEVDARAMIATTDAHRAQLASHVGLRFGGAAPKLSVYVPIS